MDEKWKIELYENSRGEKLVEEFFDSLDKKANFKITHAFELLEAFGLEGGYPHIKKLTGTNLWEYRILGADSIRILYVSMTGRTFLILHGFKKKKQKTPAKEIKIAEDRLQEYLLRKAKYN
ncbi:MAG: type II toxin-antitoxin system RelE/ParE family toxin [Candidatus Daviesbacteria bacterium]|nr:type II toxin-antitoxin system RelE/ParE family toxin [Candidatus Daviesbacteria bacterium]